MNSGRGLSKRDWVSIICLALLFVGAISSFELKLNKDRQDEVQRVNQERKVEQRHNTGILYRTQLRGCVRNNTPRRLLFEFAEAAAATRRAEAETSAGELREIALRAAQTYERTAQELASQEYANANGTIDCDKAVKQPLSGAALERKIRVRRVPEQTGPPAPLAVNGDQGSAGVVGDGNGEQAPSIVPPPSKGTPAHPPVSGGGGQTGGGDDSGPVGTEPSSPPSSATGGSSSAPVVEEEVADEPEATPPANSAGVLGEVFEGAGETVEEVANSGCKLVNRLTGLCLVR